MVSVTAMRIPRNLHLKNITSHLKTERNNSMNSNASQRPASHLPSPPPQSLANLNRNNDTQPQSSSTYNNPVLPMEQMQIQAQLMQHEKQFQMERQLLIQQQELLRQKMIQQLPQEHPGQSNSLRQQQSNLMLLNQDGYSLGSSSSSSSFPESRSTSLPVSPNISRVSASPAPSTSRKRKSPTPEPTGKKKIHSYSIEEETYIAKLPATPKTWSLLSGPGEKTQHNENKSEVRKRMLDEINKKFGINLNDKQLKNKITTMESCWKAAHSLFKKTGNGDTPTSSLKDRVLKQCHFYDILYPVATKSIKLNPPKIFELTEDHDPTTTVTLDEVADDDENETSDVGDEDVREISPPLTKKSKRSEILSETEQPGKKKGRGGQGPELTLMLKSVMEKQDRQSEFTERKLKVEEENLLITKQVNELHADKLKAEVRKANAEADMAELEARKMRAEIERLEAEVRKFKAQAEREAQRTDGITGMEESETFVMFEKKVRKSPENSPNQSPRNK